MQIRPRRKFETGGILCMPLKKNIPKGRDGWTLTRCPNCGRECWERPLPEGITKDSFDGALCTECALELLP